MYGFIHGNRVALHRDQPLASRLFYYIIITITILYSYILLEGIGPFFKKEVVCLFAHNVAFIPLFWINALPSADLARE
jgi:hypothetical protein